MSRRRLKTTKPVSSRKPTKRGFGTGAGRRANPYSRTRIIARAMILAAEAESPDGTLVGWLREASRKDRASYLSALMRVIAVQGWSPHLLEVKNYAHRRVERYPTMERFYENEEDEDE